MNVIFAHVAKQNIYNNSKQSLVFNKFLDISFFNQSMQSCLQSRQTNLIYLVYPTSDHKFITDKIDEIKDYPGIQKIRTLPISKNQLNCFSKKNVSYNPITMETTPYYGCWDINYLLKIINQKRVTNYLMFNIDSLWFLSPNAIDQAFNIASRSNFLIKTPSEFDLFIGASTNLTIINTAKNRTFKKNKRKLLKENFQNLTEISFQSTHDKISNLRDQRIDNSKVLSPSINDLLDHRKPPNKLLSPLIKSISNQSISFSLINQYGENILKTIQQIIKEMNPKEIANTNFSNLFLFPKLMNIECAKVIDKNFLLNTKKMLKNWNSVNYLVLSNYQKIEFQNIFNLLQIIRTQFNGYLYFESSLSLIRKNRLKELFDHIDVLIIEIDQYVETHSYLELDNYLQEIVDITKKFDNKFLIFKTRNTIYDQEFMCSLIHRWEHIVDGIYISDESNKTNENSYHIATKQSNCSIVPHQIYIKNNLLSICKNDSKQIKPDNHEAWVEHTTQANKMKICTHCYDKHKYIKKAAFTNQSQILKQTLIEHLKKTKLADINSLIETKQFSESLSQIEEILSSSPCNKEAWKLLTKIEGLVTL